MSRKQARNSDLFRQVLNVDWHLVASRTRSHPHEAQYVDEYDRTPLHVACLPADVPLHVIDCLLEAFPQATMTRNKWGATPLHCACLYSENKVVQRLLEANLDAIHVKNVDGYTPLLHMMKWFEFNFTRALAMFSKNSQRRFPSTIQSITKHQDPELERLWKNACLLIHASHHGTIRGLMNTTSLHVFAAFTECPGFLFDFALILHKEDLHQRDQGGNLPLHVAVSASSLLQGQASIEHTNEKRTIEKLVDASPESTKVLNIEGDLPLHLAIRNGQIAGDVIKVFNAFHGASSVLDCKLMLYPFMCAAVGENASLDTTFLLLRACPELERFA